MTSRWLLVRCGRVTRMGQTKRLPAARGHTRMGESQCGHERAGMSVAACRRQVGVMPASYRDGSSA